MNQNHAVITAETSNGSLTAENINTLIQAGVLPKDTPRAQIMIFAQICSDKGLSPFSKEIYLVGYNGKYSPIVGIDGYRKLARMTGEHAGTDDTKFDLLSDGSYKTAAELVISKKYPISATVTVYRIVAGMKTAYTHTALFSEFAGSGKWKSMPFQMIGKVAESFALRKGFNDKLTGLRIEEEIDALNDTNGAVLLSDEQQQELEETYNVIQAQINEQKTIEDLTAYFKKNTKDNPSWMADKKIMSMFGARKVQIMAAGNINVSPLYKPQQ